MRDEISATMSPATSIRRTSWAFPDSIEEDAVQTGPLRRCRGPVAVGVATALGLSACGATAASPESTLDAIKKKGVLVIATDASYPPNEFKHNGRLVGFDIDLGTDIARRLGVTARFREVEFGDILPEVRTGKYDIGLSSITDTVQRERSLDFVTYFSAGTSLMVKAGNPRKLSPRGLSLCGKKIAVQKGTTQEDELTPRSADHPDDGARRDAGRRKGRPVPVRMSVRDQDAADAALAEGRADAVLADSPVAGYSAKASSGRLAVAGAAYDTAPYGVAVPKTQDDLRNAILKAVKDMIGDGFYKMFGDAWGVTDGGITDPVVNGGAG